METRIEKTVMKNGKIYYWAHNESGALRCNSLKEAQDHLKWLAKARIDNDLNPVSTEIVEEKEY
uniref:Uncharacterized protein n=1 Tax=viral metagenome TaxID=1070528 RepID=A0A6M3KUB6_9ZZZZ